jgi:hypothetical protein
VISAEVVAAAVGGGIAIVASISTTLITRYFDVREKRKAVGSVAAAEIAAIQVALESYLKGQIPIEAVRGTTPLLATIAADLGYLTVMQARAYRVAVTLFAESKITGSSEQAQRALQACSKAMGLLPSR